MASYKTKRTLKQILAVALAGLAAFGAIFGLVKLSEALKEETKVIHPSFSVGGLNADGKYEETNGSIYTKESFECQGMSVKLDFDSNVSYQAFYYDDLDKYISSSPVYEESMDLEVPETAAYARLEVTPIWADDVEDEDQVVHWYNVASYANQLEISVNKSQDGEWDYKWQAVSLTDDDRFTYIAGVYYTASGMQSAAANGEYDSYVFTATAGCKVYVESDFTTFQYVVIRTDGTAVRYQKANGTYSGGEEHPVELLAGDQVAISFNPSSDPALVTFCEEIRAMK